MLILYCTYIDRKIFPDRYVQFISDYNQKRINKMTTARNLTLNQIITGELLLNNVLKDTILFATVMPVYQESQMENLIL